MGLWVTKQFRELGNLLYVGQVEDLNHIEERDGMVEIGAAVTLEKAYAALITAHPELEEMWKRLAAGPQCRHAGRQYRQRFAHRRLDAGADRAGHGSGAAARRNAPHAAAGRPVPGLPEDRDAAGRIRRRAARAGGRPAALPHLQAVQTL